MSAEASRISEYRLEEPRRSAAIEVSVSPGRTVWTCSEVSASGMVSRLSAAAVQDSTGGRVSTSPEVRKPGRIPSSPELRSRISV